MSTANFNLKTLMMFKKILVNQVSFTILLLLSMVTTHK